MTRPAPALKQLVSEMSDVEGGEIDDLEFGSVDGLDRYRSVTVPRKGRKAVLEALEALTDPRIAGIEKSRTAITVHVVANVRADSRTPFGLVEISGVLANVGGSPERS